MKKFLMSVLLMLASAVSFAQAPVSHTYAGLDTNNPFTSRNSFPYINTDYIVGFAPLTSIQTALTQACNYSPFSNSGRVVIPPGVTPPDDPLSVTGCSTVSIVDFSSYPWACYTTTGTSYSSVNCSSGGGGGGGIGDVVVASPLTGGGSSSTVNIACPQCAYMDGSSPPSVQGIALVTESTTNRLLQSRFILGLSADTIATTDSGLVTFSQGIIAPSFKAGNLTFSSTGINTAGNDFTFTISTANLFLAANGTATNVQIGSGNTFTLGALSGCLSADSTTHIVTGSGSLCGGSGSSPGGSTHAVQFNSSGSFGGTNFTGIVKASTSADPSAATAADINALGNITNSTSGNAGTATILQTTRTINGTGFNGSANITITAAPSGTAGGALAGSYPNPTIAGLGSTASVFVQTDGAGNLQANVNSYVDSDGFLNLNFPGINIVSNSPGHGSQLPGVTIEEQSCTVNVSASLLAVTGSFENALIVGHNNACFATGQGDPDISFVVATGEYHQIPNTSFANVTNLSLTSNVVTITASNSFSAGQFVEMFNLTVTTVLNGQIFTIISASSTQFTFAFTHAPISATGETGNGQVVIDNRLELSNEFGGIVNIGSVGNPQISVRSGLSPNGVFFPLLGTGLLQTTSGLLSNGNLSGDITTSGTLVTTLATVSSTSGTCGDATHVCQVVTNAKGLVTSQSAILITGGGSGFPITIGSTSIASGSTTTTIAGLTLTSPTLTTPALGTPASGVITNLTGTGAINITGSWDGVTCSGTPSVGWLPTATSSSACTWQVASGGTVVWSGIGNPTGNQTLSMGNNTTTWTFGTATGATTPMITLTDTASNTGTGPVLKVATAASSAGFPAQFFQRGVALLTIGATGGGTGSGFAGSLWVNATSNVQGAGVYIGLGGLYAIGGSTLTNSASGNTQVLTLQNGTSPANGSSVSEAFQAINSSFSYKSAGIITGTLVSDANTAEVGSLSFSVITAGSPVNLLTLASARKGTFTCTGAGTISITNSNYITTSDVAITMNTAGGTITTPPAFKTVTSGSGFSMLCGATDTSVYNYLILN